MSEMLLFGDVLGLDCPKQYQDDLLATLLETPSFYELMSISQPSFYELMSISQRARSCSAFVFLVYS